MSPAGYCTLQWVEDGEEVHEGQVDRPPGEQSKAPRHPQQEGETDGAPQISQNLDHTTQEGVCEHLLLNTCFRVKHSHFTSSHRQRIITHQLWCITDLLSQRAVAAFAVAAADLHHHHDEHGHVQQKHQAEVSNTGGVEDDWTVDPAADERKKIRDINITDTQRVSVCFNNRQRINQINTSVSILINLAITVFSQLKDLSAGPGWTRLEFGFN